MAVQKVTLEVWNKAKKPIADISTIVENRGITLKRNAIGTLTFSVNTDRVHDYFKAIGLDPSNVLKPGARDIIIKVDGQPWRGFELVGRSISAAESSSRVQYRGNSFLSLLRKRHVTKTYPATTETTGIATDLINLTQAKTRGDFGIIIGSQYVTGVTRERTYERMVIADALVNLTKLESGTFDFDFDYDKTFRTYPQIGSLKSTPLSYGAGGNIKSFSLDTEADAVENDLVGLGAGFGPDQVTASALDVASQLELGLREGLPLFSSVTTPSVLQENTNAYLAASKDLLEIPRPTVTSNHLNIGDLVAGDRYRLDLTRHPLCQNVHGIFRAEQIDITLNESDFGEFTFTFDQAGVQQSA